jgi:hypothetical protein
MLVVGVLKEVRQFSGPEFRKILKKALDNFQDLIYTISS